MTKHHCHFKYSETGEYKCTHPKNPLSGTMLCTGNNCPFIEPTRVCCPIASTLFEKNMITLEQKNVVKSCGWADSCRIMENREKGEYPECTEEGVVEWQRRFDKAFNGE